MPTALDPDTPAPELRILEAALEVFGRKGRDGATMREIADRAGLQRPLVHYYFRTKDGLYEAVVRRVFDAFMASLGDALEQAPSFAETLRAFIATYVDHMSAHRPVVGLLVNENLDGGSTFGKLLRDALAAPEPTPPRIMIERIQRAVEEGEIRPVDPRHTVLSIVSLCLFFLVTLPTVRVLEPLAEEDFPAFLEARKNHIFELLYRGLVARDGRAETA